MDSNHCEFAVVDRTLSDLVRLRVRYRLEIKRQCRAHSFVSMASIALLQAHAIHSFQAIESRMDAYLNMI